MDPFPPSRRLDARSSSRHQTVVMVAVLGTGLAFFVLKPRAKAPVPLVAMVESPQCLSLRAEHERLDDRLRKPDGEGEQLSAALYDLRREGVRLHCWPDTL